MTRLAIVRFYSGIIDLWYKYRFIFFCLFFFLCLLYLPLLSGHLVNNYDGLWWENEFKAGYWEMRCGRWVWPIIDNLKFGIIANPYSSYFALGIFAISTILAIDLFSIDKQYEKFLITVLFLSSTTICSSLSFPHQSLTFAFGFFFCVLAAKILSKKRSFLYILLSGLTVTLSLGCYQAFFPCTILLVIFISITKLTNNEDYKEIGKYITANILSLVSGALIYKLIWSVSLKLLHLSLPNYQGANNISLIDSLQNLPSTIQKTFNLFFSFFSGRLFNISTIPYYIIFIGIFLCFLLTFYLINKTAKNRLSLFGILTAILLSIPITCSCYLLLTAEAEVYLHMTLALTFLIPLFLCFVLASKSNSHIMISKYIKAIACLVACLAIYGNISMVSIEQTAMDEGRNSTETIISTVINRLDEEGLLRDQQTYVFIGRPCDNCLFKVSNLWNRANEYHRFGEFGNSAACQSLSYRGVLYHMGIKMQLGTLEEYENVIKDKMVKAMPVFPQNGSILQTDNNIVVIKIAETI